MMGIPDNKIKAMGCWHSDSFLRYKAQKQNKTKSKNK
jgi:hypothetical protein